MIRFRMLGTLDLKDSQGRELRAVLRRPKLLALLAYLGIARPPGFHRRDTLVALLWPELDHTHARNALRQVVHALREALGADVVLARGEEEVGVSEDHLSCDVREFEKSLAAGQAEQALELYRGGLLSGLHLSGVPEFERWLDEEREHVRRRACEAARLLTDRADAAGNATGAAGWALRLTELSPSDEPAVRRLMQLLDRTGDQAGAVRAYQEFHRRLARDLELQPSSETRALVQAVRARREPEAPAAVVPSEVATGSEHAARHATQPSGSRPPTVRPARVAGKRAAAVLALLAGGLVTGGWFVFRGQISARSAEAAHSSKRLVVLPFINLGPAEDGYFADGITEEITTRLAAVERFRVIGTTSANVYKGTKKTLREIGTELGVDYVIEGAIRWQKSPRGPTRVRITPQLVSTVDGTHLWAQVYDEPLDEIFRVQSDIAENVLRALDVTLPEPQRRAVNAAPTSNLQAYDYYLRGIEYERRNSGTERDMRTAARMYEKAVELDPRFALAYARLSREHSRIYLFHYDRSDGRLAQAKRAVDKAFELEPGLPEAHHSLGTYYWLGYLDYERALREFAIAEASRPNDSEIIFARAVLRMRQGKLREALVDFEKARQLDPARSGIAGNHAQVYVLLRDYPRAEALFDRAITLSPNSGNLYFMKAGLYLHWDGGTQRARAVLDEASKVGVADEPLLLYARVLVEIVDRRYQEAIHLLASNAPEVIADQNRFIPRTQLYAQVYGLMRRPDLERAYYDSARTFLSQKVQEQPDDPRLHSALGVAYAGLGRRQEAVHEAEKAVELLPISKEALRGHFCVWELARVYTMVGEYDAAVDRLEYLLSIPAHLTSAWLRIDPTWDPLRGHPRFQRLLARAK